MAIKKRIEESYSLGTGNDNKNENNNDNLWSRRSHTD
jgi:hypothetical protein